MALNCRLILLCLSTPLIQWRILGFVHVGGKRKNPLVCKRLCSALHSGVNGDATKTENSQMILGRTANNILASAFAALDEREQYDTVLTGLCAKILDGDTTTKTLDPADEIAEDAILTPSQRAYEKMKDPILLLKEMNSRKVTASGRSLVALVDAASSTQDVRAIATVLSLAIQNGSASVYGSKQTTINPFPSSADSLVSPRTGSSTNKGSQTRAERLEKLPDVPTDERSTEIAAALASMGAVGLCLLLQGVGNAVGLDDITPYTNLVLVGFTSLLIFDNFYDGIQFLGSTLVRLNEERLPDIFKSAKLPEKESNPFGLGTGKITGKIVRGFTRLVSVETERECQCEAAAFYAAYSLGLPCFSFRPNALEGAMLILESNQGKSDQKSNSWDSRILNPLLSQSGLMKMLIWLLAPVAMESSLHPQLLASDSREAQGLINRLLQKVKELNLEQDLGDISFADSEMKDLLKWAYSEADILLRSNKSSVSALTERLIGGAATVGDCVAILEGW